MGGQVNKKDIRNAIDHGEAFRVSRITRSTGTFHRWSSCLVDRSMAIRFFDSCQADKLMAKKEIKPTKGSCWLVDLLGYELGELSENDLKGSAGMEGWFCSYDDGVKREKAFMSFSSLSPDEIRARIEAQEISQSIAVAKLSRPHPHL